VSRALARADEWGAYVAVLRLVMAHVLLALAVVITAYLYRAHGRRRRLAPPRASARLVLVLVFIVLLLAESKKLRRFNKSFLTGGTRATTTRRMPLRTTTQEGEEKKLSKKPLCQSANFTAPLPVVEQPKKIAEEARQIDDQLDQRLPEVSERPQVDHSKSVEDRGIPCGPRGLPRPEGWCLHG